MKNSSIFSRWNLRQVVNASGTMTALGASRIVPEAQEAMTEIAGEFIHMDELLDRASDAIQRLTGAEAGFVTASVSSGLVVAMAACMTGADRGRIMRLPDTEGLPTEAIIQVGHLVDYGTTVELSLRLPGGKPVPVGSVSRTHDFQIESAINERTACVVYVVSHHTVQYGMVPLERVVEVAHARNIPVIVDAASEYDLRGFLEKGADIVIYSGHKFLGGPTSGMMAGRKDLIEACRLQNLGVGRPMKIGKESIAGLIGALEAWEARDHAGIRRDEDRRIDAILEGLSGVKGIAAQKIPDPTNNPLDRVVVHVFPEKAGMTATELAEALANEPTPIVVRGHEAELGHFLLDVCNMRDGEETVVCEAIKRLVA